MVPTPVDGQIEPPSVTNVPPPILQLQDIPFLTQPHCKIRDPGLVKKYLNEFILGGPQRMQVVSDFDYTITKQHTKDGTPLSTSFGIFNKCQSLPGSFVEASKELYHKYRPMEIDPHMSKEDKTRSMIEWWSQTSDLLKGFPFDESEIDQIAVMYKHSLRDGSAELFDSLHSLNIPVLVFSAGLGNSVESVLKIANVYHPNMKVISNFLQFHNGMLNGFQEPMIHTFNKNETVLKGSEYYDLVHNRDHIIVMGDSLGDAGMAEGVPTSSHIIKIGFLFDHIDENLEKYMEAFDIVLVDDQTMDVPLGILALIKQYQTDIKPKK